MFPDEKKNTTRRFTSLVPSIIVAIMFRGRISTINREFLSDETYVHVLSVDPLKVGYQDLEEYGKRSKRKQSDPAPTAGFHIVMTAPCHSHV